MFVVFVVVVLLGCLTCLVAKRFAKVKEQIMVSSTRNVEDDLSLQTTTTRMFQKSVWGSL